jgi:hypothetical protein
VPVISETGSIEALVGNWAGQYSSAETGRSGSITFQLASEKDTAYGDVVMVPRPRTPLAAGTEHAPMAVNPAQNPGQSLTIRFVRMEGGSVSGTLAPYNDPECGCRVITTFAGRFTDSNTIEGTYDTRGTGFGHQPSAGTWKVTRQASTHSDTSR